LLKTSIKFFVKFQGQALFTPLESPSIPACRQTGMLGMVEIPAKAGASVPY
jgi:hypothetical protein